MLRALTLGLLVLTACGRSDVYRTAPPRFDAHVPDAGLDSGTPDPCEEVLCQANARCNLGRCVCNDGYEPDGGSCQSIAAKLAGLRWDLPCVTPLSTAPEYVCITTVDVVRSTRISGPATQLYELKLRIRGVVETKRYTGGVSESGSIVRGGIPDDDSWNVYRLQVSAPSQLWYLNSAVSGEYVCHAVDQLLTVRATGGATFTLFASAVDADRTEIRNRQEDAGTITVPGVPPFPAAFDGQFLQMDVESIRAL